MKGYKNVGQSKQPSLSVSRKKQAKPWDNKCKNTESLLSADLKKATTRKGT